MAYRLVDVAPALGVLARRERRTSGRRVSMTRIRTVIFAKAPLPGFAKTRLIPALGTAGAASLASRLLEHAVDQALASGIGPVELCVTPGKDHTIWDSLALPVGVSMTEQGTGDLGIRMARATQRTVRSGENLLLIGTDCPQLDRDQLRSAATALESADACLLPVSDGGYCLIGLRHYHASLFHGIPWSTACVARITRQRLSSLGWSTREFPALHDVDEAGDLKHIPATWTLDR
jgi:hypothetical protein